MEESQVSFRQTVQTHALPSQNSCHELLLLSMNFETTPTLQLGIQQLTAENVASSKDDCTRSLRGDASKL